jgi:Tfp pilus assembly protein PilN
MPNINLIAARREEKKKIERLTRQLFMGLVGTVGVLVLVMLYVTTRQFAARAALHDAEVKWEQVKPKLARIEELKKEKDSLAPKVKTLQEAKVETRRWRAVMLAVSQAIPQEAWISGLATAGGGQDMVINLTGVASSQSVVGETMTRIGQQPIFDGVELRITQVVPPPPGDNTKRFSFDIGAHLKPAAAEPEKKDSTQKADAGTTGANGGTRNG